MAVVAMTTVVMSYLFQHCDAKSLRDTLALYGFAARAACGGT
jgi:hypothetical protein